MNSLPRFVPNWPVTVPAMWGVFALWVAALFVASGLPGGTAPVVQIPHFDKVVHFTFYATGAVSLGACLRASFPMSWRAIFLIVFLGFAGLGLADEIHQLGVAGRSGGDLWDWVADLLGTGVGLLILRTLLYGRRG